MTFLLSLLFILFSVEVFAFSENPEKQQNNRSTKAVRISDPIKIDGILDEPCWNSSTGTGGFTQREPDFNDPASEKTAILTLYDDENIYFGIRCHDTEPDKIVANEMRRDAILDNNDYIEIIIDTYHDHRNAYYFATNPAGVLVDGLIRNEGDVINMDWNGIWDCSVKLNENGWTAELIIPLRMLRFDRSDVQEWGINFGRHIPRNREDSYWSPIDRGLGFFGKYRISHYGHLEGLDDLKQGSRYEFKPYLYTGYEKEYSADIPESDKTLKGGADLKVRLTSNSIADITINTDFAQVEADPEVFNLTRFDLFFPEKREFFLEGMNIFYFGERPNQYNPQVGSSRLFFSRQIGLTDDGEPLPILGGIKSTGKIGNTNYGFLDVFTDETNYYDDDDELVNVRKANHSVFRLNQDLAFNSSIGAIAISKDPVEGSEYNRAVGIDWKISFNNAWKAVGYLAKTQSPDIHNKDYSGMLDVFWTTDKWLGYLRYHDIGENFDPQMGFYPRTDIKHTNFNFMYAPRPGILNIRQTFFFSDMNYIENHDLRLLNKDIMCGMFNLFQNGSHLMVGYSNRFEFIDEDFEIKDNVFVPINEYKMGRFFSELASDGSKPLFFQLNTELGDYYDGDLRSFNFTANAKPDPRLTISLMYLRNMINIPFEGGKFDTNIISSRITYTFSPKMYIKSFTQYNDNNDEFSTNILFSYIYKPGTNFFVVYNEIRETEPRAVMENRTLAIKLNYLFDF
ncbi:MAG: carbohydrate binding family 9 domain-containing protein [bacterium]|nr:carbohydrate binding family 9 domain-containing protein [bacterium]